ncbi:MAG: L-threonylcarbamoyladenylate synthase [bacterium]|nr:L-threonylcarbamoyladenylate synthase [bacterium]
MEFIYSNIDAITNSLKEGKVIVLPSDTLYGFSCLALSPISVEKIYTLKQRENNKPFIILISDISELEKFGIKLNDYQLNFLKLNWPASLTVVFDVTDEKFSYLHRGIKSLGFRIPANQLLIDILRQVGPITSTTVNISGQPPVKTVDEAIKLFGSKIDLYVENGVMQSEPSTVIKLDKSSFAVLRQGKVLL